MSLQMRGQRGDGVRGLQQALNDRSSRAIRLRVDGFFGPRTEAAVREFQRERGLEVDGIAGPDTWAQLPGKPPLDRPTDAGRLGPRFRSLAANRARRLTSGGNPSSNPSQGSVVRGSLALSPFERHRNPQGEVVEFETPVTLRQARAWVWPGFEVPQALLQPAPGHSVGAAPPTRPGVRLAGSELRYTRFHLNLALAPGNSQVVSRLRTGLRAELARHNSAFQEPAGWPSWIPRSIRARLDVWLDSQRLSVEALRFAREDHPELGVHPALVFWISTGSGVVAMQAYREGPESVAFYRGRGAATVGQARLIAKAVAQVNDDMASLVLAKGMSPSRARERLRRTYEAELQLKILAFVQVLGGVPAGGSASPKHLVPTRTEVMTDGVWDKVIALAKDVLNVSGGLSGAPSAEGEVQDEIVRRAEP